jgi:hypothetical protein
MEITLFKQALVFNPFDDARKALDENASATDMVPRRFQWHGSDGKLQIPSSKLQAPEKFQAPNLNGPPWMATTSLGLWFGA